MHNREKITKLRQETTLNRDDLKELLTTMTKDDEEFLFSNAREVRQKHYGRDVFVRGLIEFTNYCRNNCIYCGIRAENKNVQRYRLSKDEILDCANTGYKIGFRTFVLQGGEDMYYSNDLMCDIISSLKEAHPDCAVTLSIGERDRKTYEMYFEAGADRYLLRHETITPSHYEKLHPPGMTIENRIRCLKDLKEIGFQTGCGIMIGSPGQTTENIIEDIMFMKEFKPHMIGMGPFIPHTDTPFKNEKPGNLEDTLHLLAIIRLMLPDVLLPATTALGTIVPTGRELGILAGANVVMPNLSPVSVREKYKLYDGKICTGEEAAECMACLKRRIETTGYEITVARGDHLSKKQ